MTNQHPLTDEMLREIHGNPHMKTLWFYEDDMRAAYDKGAADRLEQVIEWLTDELDYDPCLLLDLKEAMRPQQQEDS